MKEEWRKVTETRSVTHNKDYFISNLGRAKSVNVRTGVSRILSLRKGGYMDNYLKVGFGRHKDEYVHRVVYKHFVAPLNPMKEINHIDGDTHNNRVDNLELVTPKENSRHRSKIGRQGQGIVQAVIRVTTPYGKEIDVIGVKEAAKLSGLAEQTIGGAMCYGACPRGYSFKRIGTKTSSKFADNIKS